MHALTPADLHQFTGTETWHRHALNRNMLYTDGVQFFAENAGNGAYWFLDIVATEMYGDQLDAGFLHIKLDVVDDKALITWDDGNGNDIGDKKIEYTDCPEGAWEFYFTDNVLLLPSEY